MLAPYSNWTGATGNGGLRLVVGSGDDFLRGVLGGESYTARGNEPGVRAPQVGGSSEAADEIAATSAAARAGEETRYESNQVDSTYGIGASISGQAFAQLGKGGGYALDPEQLSARINGVEAILSEIDLARNDCEAASEASYSPTTDADAVAQAETTRRVGEDGAAYARALRNALEDWVDGARKALGTYQGHEDATAEELDRTDPDSGEGSSGTEGTGSLYEKGGQ